MGADGGVVRALGYLVGAAILLSAGGVIAIGYATGNPDLTILFLPLVASYATIMLIVWAGMALLGFIRSRFGKAH